jgi:hypothetical protein
VTAPSQRIQKDWKAKRRENSRETGMLPGPVYPMPGVDDATEDDKERRESFTAEEIRRLVCCLSSADEDFPPSGFAGDSRSGSCAEGPENDNYSLEHVCESDASDLAASSEDWIQQFEEGVHYPLIPGRLYFSAHPDEEYTRQCIKYGQRLFYFSSYFPGDALLKFVSLHVRVQRINADNKLYLKRWCSRDCRAI